MEKIKFSRSLLELERIFSFLNDSFEKLGISDQFKYEFELSLEEIFTNMVKYNRDVDSEIEIGIDKTENAIIARLTDCEITPFDITKKDEVDLVKYIKEGRAGGLALVMI